MPRVPASGPAFGHAPYRAHRHAVSGTTCPGPCSFFSFDRWAAPITPVRSSVGGWPGLAFQRSRRLPDDTPDSDSVTQPLEDANAVAEAYTGSKSPQEIGGGCRRCARACRLLCLGRARAGRRRRGVTRKGTKGGDAGRPQALRPPVGVLEREARPAGGSLPGACVGARARTRRRWIGRRGHPHATVGAAWSMPGPVRTRT